jgi:glycerol-3-phosphate dehydrogenase
VDRVGPILTPGRNERRVQGTKGSHLMVRNLELLAALDGRMIYHENADGRICIVFNHLGLAMVGSTDIRVDDPDAALCHEDEKTYMLEALRRVFPDIAITDDQIVHVFTGVRPLPASPEGATARISRDHAVELDHHGGRAVLTLIGGKWTTFRAFGAEVADAALAQLGLPRRRGTEDMPIGGGRGLPPADRREGWIRQEAGRATLPSDRMAGLVMRYGTRAVAVARFLAQGPDAPLAAAPDHTRRELLWIVRHEKVRDLSDLLMRRTSLGIEGRVTDELIAETAPLVAEELGWSEAEAKAAAQRLRMTLSRRHRVLPTPS